MKSRSSWKLGHIGSKTRMLGQIFEKPCVHSRGHSFVPKLMKLCQNVNPYKIQVMFETGSCWIKKTRPLGKILEKPWVHPSGHSFDPKFMKLCQNVYPFTV